MLNNSVNRIAEPGIRLRAGERKREKASRRIKSTISKISHPAVCEQQEAHRHQQHGNRKAEREKIRLTDIQFN